MPDDPELLVGRIRERWRLDVVVSIGPERPSWASRWPVVYEGRTLSIFRVP